MSYTIGSGYYCASKSAEEFSRIWIKNIELHANPFPKKIVVVSVDGCHLPFDRPFLDEITLDGNLGHVHGLLGIEGPKKDHEFCGWSGAVLATAMIAYCNETDFCWWEQDVLAFGDVIGQMYRDMGDRQMVFGGPMRSPPNMPCAQGLFLVRHRFIPTFVKSYIGKGSDASRVDLPEHKFASLARFFTSSITRLSFGVDRERPIPYTAPVFYCQHVSEAELAIMRTAGLI
jgi:hypothetical protein